MNPNQRGSMLLSAIFMMLLMGGLMAGVAIFTSQGNRALLYEVLVLKARMATESILEQKAFELLADTDAVGDVQISLNGCTAIARVGAGSTAAQMNVLARSECSSGELTVQRNLEVEIIE